MNSSKFPKELGDMLQNADPAHASSFIADMATFFAKTNLHSSDMRKILPMKLIYDPTKLRDVDEKVMTIGKIMEDTAIVAKPGPSAETIAPSLSLRDLIK